MSTMDFPASPYIGQTWTNVHDTTYTWDGYSWVLGGAPPIDETMGTLAGILQQIRVLLQDTDVSSGEYRYSTSSIIMNLNQGMLEMFRLRPDIFLETAFVVPTFRSSDLTVTMPIEQQWVPPLVYYAVGMTQARDDEQTQDTRAAAFMTTFKQTLLAIA